MKELFGQSLDDVLRKDKEGIETGRSSKKTTSIIKPYELLEWELECDMMSYTPHINRIFDENWERAPSPQEVFSLLIDHYEGKLDRYFEIVANDILNSMGEYFCDAYLLDSDSLEIYEKISDGYYIDSDIGLNIAESDWYDKNANFKINMKTGKDYDISELPEDIVKYFCTLPYEQLPLEIKRNTTIHIPLPNVIYPLSRESYNSFHILIIYNEEDICLSRGVREK